MGRINVLDKHVAELIAAGEVVERPSSVIKELVENSIDAGSKSITVEIKNGGTTFMRVTDDGMGIMRDDVRNAFLRHATSKVAKESDLDTIATLGFRGEALASVSAVAKVELITCADNEDVGTCYRINGGEESEFSDAGCPVGTTIIVRDLFYNIPARQKFLKKDVAEGNAVSLVMDRIALSHPEIAFTFIRDSKQVLKTSGDGKLKSAIYAVYGRDFSNSLIDVDYELGGVRVEGFISRPENARPNRNMQTFFVNNRYVRSRTAGAAVDEAAKGSVMVGKFLCCVLNISMSFSAVDVNVHPAKIEVRFVNERPLFDAVYHAVKSALLKGDRRKEAILSAGVSTKKQDPFAQFDLRSRDVAPVRSNEVTRPTNSPVSTITQNASPFTSSDKTTPFYKRRVEVSDSKQVDNYLASLEIVKEKQEETSLKKATDNIPQISKESINISTADHSSEPLSEKKDVVTHNESSVIRTKIPESPDINTLHIKDETISHSESLLIDSADTPEFKYVGEVFRTYIVIEIDKELLLIDKHALHERIIYEQIKSQAENFSQLLLVPQTVTLDKGDYSAVVDNLDMFRECGFEVEDFGMPSVLVRSAPQYITGEDIESTVAEMAGYIAENRRDIRSEKMDWIFHNIACRAAVKAGNRSTEPELRELAQKILNDDSLRYCPHGRPVCIVLKKSEIEKQFGRA
ncbi:MAG: DNA mismatch repair endonuclease MutL [Clostridia bacterium]|nr:DNA mismatch repair endonuclease MutL [Clostridia bacterium]